ncbi:short-chain dehydrogenase [Frondihabitans sp. PAMC 28766]|uniref:oxidoreductase n=1 Tax=Frondihabitans sp. PAMC 28766 TaxID=1795630 RepID=UPI00078BB6C5|nr:oxidoreductase [Frondihabitans sp. PAMC 28766]AMM20042.1 short-chain dehydrogenase [Frondihabitans sp. PAMC 28766]
MSTWLITGCSTGLGRHLAAAVLAAGHSAVVTARNVDAVADLQSQFPDSALAVALDVTDDSQVAAAVQAGIDRFGAIDVLVNNAGYGYRAAVEEGEVDAVQQLFDTHLFGSVATIKAVLPGMRARRSGSIVNVSSIGARISPPGSGYYSAVKAALEALSGSLAKEVEPLGIHVTVVEPGGFRTDFAGRSLTQSAEPIADYAETAGPRRIENDTVHGTQPGDPDKAATAIIGAVEAEKPPFMLILGDDALGGFRQGLQGLLDEADAWADVSRSTGF